MKHSNKARQQWLELLTRELDLKLKDEKDDKYRIGIIGALGAYDVGDEAMLCALIRDLEKWRSDIEFTIFSTDPSVTDDYLGTESRPTLHCWLRNRKKVLPLVLYLLGHFETKAIRLIKRFFKIREINTGGWFLRGVFRLLFIRLEWLAKHHKRNGAGADSSTLSKHVREIANIDVLIMLGGAYINSWHVKAHLYLFFMTVKVALLLGKPVFGTGLNFGPFNSYDLKNVAEYLKEFSLIGVRDNRESFDLLKKMDIWDPAVHRFCSDDAVTLEASAAGSAKLEEFVKNLVPYMAVHIHKWKLNANELDKLYDIMARTITAVVKKYNIKVLLIPMTFGRQFSCDGQSLREIKERCQAKDRLVMAPADLNPMQLKFLFSNARCTIASRHHAMVFSISEGVPCVVLEFDRYYRMKLQGVAQDYPGLCYMIPLEDISHKLLLSNIDQFWTVSKK